MVGSGSGGSVAAARLSEANNMTTLLLEAACRDAMLTTEVIILNIKKYFFNNFLEFISSLK